MEAYQELEHKWAEFNGLDPKGMVACSSGTAALHLALESLQLPQGSEVIVPDLTMIAVPRAVSMAGLVPVFVDCDDTLNMDAALLPGNSGYDFEAGDAPSVVIAVHTYGRQCDMTQITLWANKYPKYVIEDLAEAHGVKPHSETDAACWSFYKNKVVSGEEGGAVWFRDPAHAALARQLRSLGFTDAHDFTHIPRGHNYRMSNAHASLILDSLRRVDLSLENRWVQWEIYDKLCPKEWRMARPDVPWVYCLRVKGLLKVGQDIIVRALRNEGIEARHCFQPACDQQEYRSARMVAGDNINGTKSRLAAREVVYLPLSSYNTRCHLGAFEIVKRVIG